MINNPSRKINLGVVGFGRIGKVHTNNILSNPRVNLVGIAELNPSSFPPSIQKDFKIQTLETLLKNPELEGILVLTLASQHYEQTLEILKNYSLPIFVEKPLALRDDEIAHCYEVAREKKIPLFCGFQRRVEHSILKQKKLVESQNLGKIHTVRLISRDYPKLPPGYWQKLQFIDDFFIHDLDLASYFVNPNEDNPVVEAYTRITSVQKAFAEKGVIDAGIALLKFQNGEICIIDNCLKSNCGYDARVEIIGEKGKISIENPVDNTMVFVNQEGNYSSSWQDFNKRWDNAFNKELDLFCDHIEEYLKGTFDENQIVVKEKDCINAANLITMCNNSEKNKSKEVKTVEIKKREKNENNIKKNLEKNKKIGFGVLGEKEEKLGVRCLRESKDTEILYYLNAENGLDKGMFEKVY